LETLPPLLADQFQALSVAEGVAVVAAVLYLLLAIRQNIWCWVFAGLSTALYVVLFVEVRLYMESALNVFYFAMAVYGFRFWLVHGRETSGPRVTRWPLPVHAVAILAILVLSFVTGFSLARLTDAEFPYVDSLTTFAALWTTFLVARKVLENWWYWLVIDTVSIWLYWERGLELTAMLFAAYVVMIPFGLVAWTRSMHDRPAAAGA
jgi:nicotinamide mononucleotide transporter